MKALTSPKLIQAKKARLIGKEVNLKYFVREILETNENGLFRVFRGQFLLPQVKLFAPRKT